MNKNNCRPDYHINLVYCGGCCVSQYKEYNQTLKLVESEYSKHHMIVSSSDWSDYNDTIKYRESKYYCMISNGCFINIPKPSNLNKEYSDECVIVKITNDNS
jgi:hypothetical protein